MATNTLNAPATLPLPAVRVRDVLAAKIRVVTKENPKKPGTIAHKTFEMYKDGMTVAAYLALPGIQGGRTRARANVVWDAQRGFIRLEE